MMIMMLMLMLMMMLMMMLMIDDDDDDDDCSCCVRLAEQLRVTAESLAAFLSSVDRFFPHSSPFSNSLYTMCITHGLVF